MKLKYLICFFLLCICFSEVHAQWDAQISQYWKVKTFYNPAFAGEIDSLRATALHRQQWIGVDNAPKTFIVTADMPLNFLGKKHGVGAVFMTESIGLFKNSTYAGQYAYKKKIKKNTLSLGVQLGISSITFDADKIYIPDNSSDHDPNDEAIPGTGDASTVFDANIGITWVAPKYYVGLAMSHALEPSFDLDDTHSSYIPRTYYFTAGYNIKLRNPLYELQPSVLVKSDAVVIQYDVTARMVYNDMFNGGVTWRKDDGFVISLGFMYKNFDAGYAYDWSTSAISKVGKGSHEFFLRYSMPINLDKPEKNRHKSVRIL